MREQAYSNPTPNERKRFVPVARITYTREMSPETDDIMPLESLSPRIRAINSDPKIVVGLLSHYGGLKSAPEIASYMNRFLGDSEPVIERHTVTQYLRNFEEIGSLESEKNGNDLAFTRSFCFGTTASQLGYMAELSRKYKDLDISKVFGEAGANIPNEEVDADFIAKRVKTLRAISKIKAKFGTSAKLPISTGDISSAIGSDAPTTTRHLRSLSEAGMFTYDPIITRNGSYQMYEYNEDAKPALIRGKEGREKFLFRLRDAIESYGGRFKTDDEWLLRALNPEFDSLSDEERAREIGKIRAGVTQLRNTGVVKGRLPVLDQKATLGFALGTPQVHMLRDTVLTLLDLQREDFRTERIGKEIGQQIVNDPEAMALLIRKARAVNDIYRGRK